MKKYLIILLVIPFLFGSCKRKESAEVTRLTEENQQLLMESSQKDSTINEFIKALNEIQENLSVIRQKEQMIAVNTSKNTELKQDQKTQIEEDLTAITELMLKNKQTIRTLNSKLKKADLKISELERFITSLERTIDEKDQEIGEMQQKLEKLNIDVAGLTARVEDLNKESEKKDEVIEDKTIELNTAYYIIGSEKELKAKGIITKSGGFVGIGRAQTISKDMDISLFTKIDIRKTTSFEIDAKNPKLISTHVAGSYSFEQSNKRVNKLVITNPADFWKASKYMVLVLD